MTSAPFIIEPFGENGWLARLHGGDMVETALKANAVADRLRRVDGALDAVAGIDSLVLRYDPARLNEQTAHDLLHEGLSAVRSPQKTNQKRINIPMCYGGDHGPDFDLLCDKLGLSQEQLISAHSQQSYRVLTVGFAPGFAYLGPLPQKLQTSRLSTPRPRVPAGSVGIAGAMTGVYPLPSPGGWALIGRTPKRLFDPFTENPFQFAPGTEVTFTPIDESAYADMEEEQKWA